MIVAHLSDLHLLGEGEVAPWRYFNKRLTGLVNLKWRRHAVHKPDVARALARELRTRAVEHVVVTGDLSNLALEREFEAARTFFENDLGLDPGRVSVIPGNHDLYTQGSARSGRFARYFGPYLEGDLEGVAVRHPAGPFPYVRLRGPLAIIGLATALPRPPMFASGALGREQLRALERVLSLGPVRERLPLLLQHHPPHNPVSPFRTLTNGLWDARELRALLERMPRGVLLHGHLHERVHRRLGSRGGAVDIVGATSASLVHEHEDRIAGFNLYEFDEAGFRTPPTSYVYDPVGERFRPRAIPLVPALES
ncbi:MAG TPA: metallophosphoesterase [Polyangiaceae bacterium]|nr:metallophosphoesterase [Polyangiaceae bacterium]